MADEGVGKIFFLRKKKKPPDERTVTGETADEKATSDSTARRSGSCQQEGDAPTISACLHHMLVIKKCDFPWRRPKTPPTPLPPPQPLPSRQWQPTHQLTHRHFRSLGIRGIGTHSYGIVRLPATRPLGR